MSSMLATKYQRYGYVNMQPFLPGSFEITKPDRGIIYLLYNFCHDNYYYNSPSEILILINILNGGEKKRAEKEMERNMKGFRELRKEVEEARRNMKEMEEMNYKKEKTVQTSFYKSPVGIR